MRHEVTGLTNDTQYAFELRAVNATGEGAAAGPVTATPSTNTTPSFGTRTVADQSYVQNTADRHADVAGRQRAATRR